MLFFPIYPFMITFAFGLKARKVSKVIIERKSYSRLPKARPRGTQLKRKPNRITLWWAKTTGCLGSLPRSAIPVSTYWMNHSATWTQASRTSMRHELAELHNEYQKTTLFVTHDQVEAMTLGQRLCVMNQGTYHSSWNST